MLIGKVGCTAATHGVIEKELSEEDKNSLDNVHRIKA